MRRTLIQAAVAVVLLAAASGWPAPARAWVKVETERFIVYGDTADFTVKAYAAKLTTFDAMLRLYNPRAGVEPPVRKLEIYLVRSRRDLQRTRPNVGELTAGFYTSSPDGIYALSTLEGPETARDDVLFHEYAHYFMLENFPAAYPAWFIEGWAEYFMTTEISKEGVKVGNYNQSRVYYLFNAKWLPLEEVLSKRTGETSESKRLIYYAQAWLLTHYMQSTTDRAKQMNRITNAIAGGADPVKAFETETGMDIATLTKELRKYQRLPMVMIKGFGVTPPKMTVTNLPRSADDMMLDRLRLIGASVRRPDPAFVADVRKRAARHPGDKFAELTLARAEYAYGDVAAGEAIVNRRLQAEANDVETLATAGLGLITAGRREPARRVERYRAARPFLVKAYQLDKEDYRTLLAYALSRSAEPGYPNENDLNALLEARGLAPVVGEATVMAGAALLARNRADEARRMLAIVANDPHGGAMAAQARALMTARPGTVVELVEGDGDDDDQPPNPPSGTPKPGAKPPG